MDARYLPTSASFILTEQCNLRCEYCFCNHTDNTMTIDVIHRGLEYLCNNARMKESPEDRRFHALIFGGEPCLQPDLVEEICRFGYYLSRQKGVPFTATIITNGTIMSDEIFYIFLEYKDKINLSCQLSVDGVKEAHDSSRVTRDGKDSFDLIDRNIRTFKKIYKNNPKALNVHGCITRKNLPYLYESFHFFRETWGIEKIWFMPVHEEEWTKDDIELYEQEMDKIANYIMERAEKEGSIEEVENYAPINKCLMITDRPSSPCGAGKTFVTITPNGDIYPCHHFYFNDFKKELYMGNIWDGVDDDLRRQFLNYTSDDMSCPSDCKNTGCYRCIATNWVENGDFRSQIMGNYCKMSKVIEDVNYKVRQKLIELKLINEDDNIYFNKGKKVVKNDDYYKENGMEILAKALQLLILEVGDLKKSQQEVLDNLKGCGECGGCKS